MSISIKTSTYQTQIDVVDKDVAILKRTHTYQPVQTEIDTFGRFWLIGFSNIPPGGLSINGKSGVVVDGPVGLIIPPLSIVEWSIHCFKLEWMAFVVRPHRIHRPLVTEATLFSLPSINEISNVDQALREIRNGASHWGIEKKAVGQIQAQRAKNLLDLDTEEDRSISSVSQRLGIDPSELSRTFKRGFGISPVVYRNKLRVYDSMFRLIFSPEKNISDIGFDVGFSDLSRFNKEFKKYTLTSPKSFQER